MSTSSRVEVLSTVLLTVAALSVAGAVLHREFGAPAVARSPDVARAPEFIDDWRKLLPASERIGSDGDSTVVVIEFSDLECPFCKRFHDLLGRARNESGVRVRSVFLHYPLPQHRFALPAARSAECARLQGRFDAYVDAVFRGQDSLGLKSWSRFGAEAGVQDSAAFATCVTSTFEPQQIVSGRAFGELIGVRGTPTVVINGWRYYVPPYDSLVQILRAAVQRSALPP